MSGTFFIAPPSGGNSPVLGPLGGSLPTAYITEVWIYLHDTTSGERALVEHKTFSPAINSWTGVVRFDSSHFGPGDAISAEMDLKDTTGTVFGNSSFPPWPVVNVATIYGRSDFELWPEPSSHGAQATKAVLSQINQDVSHFNITPGWSMSDILTATQACTVFYVNTHGYYNDPPPPPGICFQTDLDDAAGNPPDQYVYPNKSLDPNAGDPPQVYETRLAAANAGVPLIGIAYINACVTGTGPEFSSALLAPGLSTPPVNQAEVGYRDCPLVAQAEQSATVFWGALQNGATVTQARDVMLNVVRGLPLPPQGDPAKYVAVYGDAFAVLHGAYTPGDGSYYHEDTRTGSRPWFLVLQ